MTHLSENDFCPIYKLVLTVGISWLLALIPTSKCSRNMAVTLIITKNRLIHNLVILNMVLFLQ